MASVRAISIASRISGRFKVTNNNTMMKRHYWISKSSDSASNRLRRRSATVSTTMRSLSVLTTTNMEKKQNHAKMIPSLTANKTINHKNLQNHAMQNHFFPLSLHEKRSFASSSALYYESSAFLDTKPILQKLNDEARAPSSFTKFGNSGSPFWEDWAPAAGIHPLQRDEDQQKEEQLKVKNDLYQGPQCVAKSISGVTHYSPTTKSMLFPQSLYNNRPSIMSPSLVNPVPTYHQIRNLSSSSHRFHYSTSTTTTTKRKSTSSTDTASRGSSSTDEPSIIPSPPAEKPSMSQQVQTAIANASRALVQFVIKLPGWTWFYLTHPKDLYRALGQLWQAAKDEAHHYWVGTKLLYADIQTATKLVRRTLEGSALTRRERKQLLRTVSDLFRLVPFSIFILIPFMEFALPFALRIFPNMLPSTFQDSLKAEENMKRELQSRIAMAQFFQETMQEMAKGQKKQAQERLDKQRQVDDNEDKQEGDSEKEEENSIAAKQKQSAASMLEFLEKARSGEMIPPDVIIEFASHFRDDLTLDNMPRMQLINMCKYMNIPPYGADAFLRFQLRHKIRTLIEDDQRILWEGIESLNKMELREACQERGMRSTGLSKDAYRRALQQWLDLSVNKNVPISLLIMSRTFFLRDEMNTTWQPSSDEQEAKSVTGLADAISGLDQDIVNEVVLEIATPQEKKNDPSVTRIKLEVVEAQNERILVEQLERDAAKKLKEEKDKEKEQQEETEPEAITAAATESLEGKETQEKADEKPAEAPETEKLDLSNAKIIVRPQDTKPEQVVLVVADPVTKDGDKVVESLEETKEEEEEDVSLSAEEIDAISQIVNPDPVNKERGELEKIKASMKSEDVDEKEAEPEVVVDDTVKGEPDSPPPLSAPTAQAAPEPESDLPQSAEMTDLKAKQTIEETDAQVASEAAQTTTFQADPTSAAAAADEDSKKEDEEDSGDTTLDRAIARLKSRVEKMVDKIETQITDVGGKIGDKLHILDKDRDGLLTKEELAHALQTVLKREISLEEAMEIAEDMDENNDGIFTVADFIQWVETHKYDQLVKEGRDAELDKIIDNVKAKTAAEEEKKEDDKGAQT